MPDNRSLAERVAALPKPAREAYIDSLSEEEAEALFYDWEFFARPHQLPPPGGWTGWLLLAGRGFGKTRTGAEWIRRIKDHTARIALIGPTAADTRGVMVEGSSGLLAIAPPWDRPLYEPSKRQVTWSNGAVATLFSADEPERLRGPQHGALWADELAAWRYPEAFDMALMGLRLGTNPRFVVTTTPRPVKLIRQLLADPAVIVTRGSTYDNQANLAPSFLSTIIKKYEGTRLGRQELDAELLEDVPGALWIRETIEAARLAAAPPLQRIVVALDPAASSGENADETGLIAAGRAGDRAYILADKSGRMKPNDWARAALTLYERYAADAIVAEANNGGEMVAATLRVVDANAPIKLVHASRGKAARAEPVSALYEQGRVHHVGAFPLLEDQMCAFTAAWDRKTAGASPDRVDALVWGISELMLAPASTGLLDYIKDIACPTSPKAG